MVSVHHFQITTSNLIKRVSQFQGQFGFRVLGHCLANEEEEVALYINSVVMVIKAGTVTMATVSDWISDVVLHVSSSKNYDQLYKRVESIKTDPYTTRTDSCTTQTHFCNGVDSDSRTTQTHSCNGVDSDSRTTQTHSCNGVDSDSHTTQAHSVDSNSRTTQTHSCTEEMRMFRVQTPFNSVHHTIITGKCNCIKWSKNQTSFSCLPNFIMCPKLSGKACSICNDRFDTTCINVPRDISHVDHVTFACHTHTSEAILKWYERYLGFRRFRINSSEDENGFIIEGTNGMKMLAMKYWQCSETCITLGENEKPVQLVFAEPLPDSGRNQVQTFLEDNFGPGVQHIAFHTDNIVGVVSCLRGNNVLFITPPPEYYTLFEKMTEIEKTDEKVELLQHNNILIDFEVYDNPPPKYLMQVFTHPLFDKDTFFLEVIQRCGATGFGAGNITALWKALEIHFKQNKTTSKPHSVY